MKFLIEISHELFVAIVTVVDSQGRGFCSEAEYSMVELSVPALFIILPEFIYS